MKNVPDGANTCSRLMVNGPLAVRTDGLAIGEMV